MQTPAIPRCSSLRTRRRGLLKLPYPVSPSSKIGKSLASAMNSSISTTCVQLASLLSRTPNCAEIDSPDAQMPLKPASRTMRADRPLWASMRNSSSALCSIWRSLALRVCAVFLALFFASPTDARTEAFIGHLELKVEVAATPLGLRAQHQWGNQFRSTEIR